MLPAGADEVGCDDVEVADDEVDGWEDDDVEGWDDEVGCAAAGTTGANASEVAASTDMTRVVRETAMVSFLS
jgi:hypothetical protein